MIGGNRQGLSFCVDRRKLNLTRIVENLLGIEVDVFLYILPEVIPSRASRLRSIGKIGLGLLFLDCIDGTFETQHLV